MTQPVVPTSGSLIYQQIESTSDFYEPAVYDLLSFYSALSLQPDEFSGQFIPLTAVPYQNAQQTLVFVVGILPPTSNVTGNLLDRSATVQATTFNPTANININPATTNGSRLAATSAGAAGGVRGLQVDGIPGQDRGPPIVYQMSTVQVATAIRDAYVARFHEQPTATELAIYTAHSFRETGSGDGNSVNWPNFNPGYIGNYNASGSYSPPAGVKTFGFARGTNPDGSIQANYFISYPNAQAGANAFVANIVNRGDARQQAKDGNLEGYVNDLYANKYFTSPSPQQYLNGFGNIQQFQSKIGDPASLNSSNLPQPQSSISGDAGTNASWTSGGSTTSNQAQQQIGQSANRNLNLTGLGQQYLAQQQALIKETLAAINTMKNTPPLRMLVNPQSFRLSADKIIADGNWGRNGPIVEHWGDGQDKLECSGKVAGFYSLDAVGQSFVSQNGTASEGAVGASPGLGRNARQFSQAYQNFLSLWLLYKNNGGLWLQNFINTGSAKPSSKPNNLSVVGSIYIFYDNILYIGSFDSFNLTETETAPFTLEYNFSFTVRATFVLDNVDQQLSYGAPLSMTTGQAPPNQVSTNPNTAPTQAPSQTIAQTTVASDAPATGAQPLLQDIGLL